MIGVDKTGQSAITEKGWWLAHKWLVLRRISQTTILALFLLGPLTGVWIVKGNLASSITLETLPLSDPYVVIQSFFAGHMVETAAITGAIIVVLFYLLVGGRVFCSWVCPVNIIADIANRLRDRWKLKGGAQFSRQTRYWLLVLTLLMAALSGTIVWEFVNPVSMVFRALIFGVGMAWLVMMAVFIFDLFISRQGWCGHLCPVGAFYSLIGKISIVRVSAVNRAKCDDCMDCFQICPENQVIRPALKGEQQGIGPVILSPNCTNCGRCIDVCAKNVFKFSTRFHNELNTQVAMNKEVTQ